MDHRLFQSVGFWVFLFSIDKKFATEACLAGCPCGGRLHRADYPRKPRGGAKGLPRESTYRMSCMKKKRKSYRDNWKLRLDYFRHKLGLVELQDRLVCD